MVWRFAQYGWKVCPVVFEGLPRMVWRFAQNWIQLILATSSRPAKLEHVRPRRAFDAPELLPQALQALQMLRIGTNASQTEDSTVESSNEGL